MDQLLSCANVEAFPQTRDIRPEAVPASNYSITIEPQSVGYLVRVGCQTFAIESKERLIEKLTAYLIDPQGTINKHNQGKLFN